MIGFSPRDVGAMSLWEYAACVDSYNKANGGEADGPLTDVEIASLSELVDAAIH